MEKREISKHSIRSNRFFAVATDYSGSPIAFMIAFACILMWFILGPVFNFSTTWQLVINTFTGIVTFLMVFIIQYAQNKDILALHLKLNELIAVSVGASNKLVSAEDLTKEELATLKEFYTKLSVTSKDDAEHGAAHTLDELEDGVQKQKSEMQKD
jgi:low affinity Fe/Cu permease